MENEFRLDGFATWVNFLVTKRHPLGARARELLRTPQRLRAWLRAVELEPRAAVTEADLAAALDLREALRVLALAHGEGAAPPRAVVRALARALEGDDGAGVAVRGDRLVRPRPVDTRSALGRIARQAIDQLAGPQRDALRVCDEHDCRWVFIDPTGRQRWCSPECANRGRVRAYRARHRRAGAEA